MNTDERIDRLVADAAAFSATLRRLILKLYEGDDEGRRATRNQVCDDLEQLYHVLAGDRLHQSLQRTLHEIERLFGDPESD